MSWFEMSWLGILSVMTMRHSHVVKRESTKIRRQITLWAKSMDGGRKDV